LGEEEHNLLRVNILGFFLIMLNPILHFQQENCRPLGLTEAG